MWKRQLCVYRKSKPSKCKRMCRNGAVPLSVWGQKEMLKMWASASSHQPLQAPVISATVRDSEGVLSSQRNNPCITHAVTAMWRLDWGQVMHLGLLLWRVVLWKVSLVRYGRHAGAGRTWCCLPRYGRWCVGEAEVDLSVSGLGSPLGTGRPLAGIQFKSGT